MHPGTSSPVSSGTTVNGNVFHNFCSNSAAGSDLVVLPKAPRRPFDKNSFVLEGSAYCSSPSPLHSQLACDCTRRFGSRSDSRLSSGLCTPSGSASSTSLTKPNTNRSFGADTGDQQHAREKGNISRLSKLAEIP